MKKFAVLVLVFVCVTAALSAEKKRSAGVGVFLDISNGNGAEGSIDLNSIDKSIPKGSMAKYVFELNNTSYGVNLYYDYTYIIADISLAFGTFTYKETLSVEGVSVSEESEYYAMQIGINLLGKYPFELGQFNLFPLIGIGYNSVGSLKDKEVRYNNGSDLSQFNFLAGAGFDYNFNSNSYVRIIGLLNVRFPGKIQKDTADLLNIDTTIGIGPRIQVCYGFNL